MEKRHDLKEIIHKRKKEIVLFFIIVPSILLCFFLLPTCIKTQLILVKENPNPLALYFSSFVHNDLDHFLSNLITYLLLIFTILNLEKDRRRLSFVIAMTFFVVPLVLSISFLVFTPEEAKTLHVSLGFSGIVSALNGYLMFCVFAYLRENWYGKLSYSFFGLIVITNFLMLITRDLFGTMMRFGVSLVFLILLWMNKKDLKRIVEIGREKFWKLKGWGKIKYLLFFALVFVFTFSLPFLWLPPDIVISKNVRINIIAHYVGYVIGWFIPLTIDLVVEGRKRTWGQ